MRELKLGVVADEISRNFPVAVREGKKAGIQHFEVRFLRSGRIPRCSARELEEVDAIVRGEGITVTAISPGLFKHAGTEPEFRRQMTEVFSRASELALRWKTKMIVFGFKKPGATEQDPVTIDGEIPGEVLDWMAETVGEAERLGIPLLLEPEPISWTDTGLRAAEMIRRVGRGGLRMNYDPGNVAWMTRRNPVDEWPEIAELVTHMHLKDTLLEPQDGKFPVWVFPGNGGIDYATLFRRMLADGFSGNVSIESHMNLSPLLLVAFKTAVERLWQEASRAAGEATS
jgi:sugar phosphate isomerase/epimerase